MCLYTETTDGSFIEVKESSLVWNYQYADPDFGSCQAKELLDHLESVLANEPVSVKSGQNIVEVKPQVKKKLNQNTTTFPLPNTKYQIDSYDHWAIGCEQGADSRTATGNNEEEGNATRFCSVHRRRSIGRGYV